MNLVARVSGNPEAVVHEPIHMTVADSNVKDVKRLPVVDGITVGAFAVPRVNAPPDSGGNTPLTRLVKEAIPGFPDE